MCLLRYFDRNYMMHTRASLMYNEMDIFWARTEYHFEYCIWRQMLTEMFAFWFITQSLLKTKQMAKEHFESQNKQQVLGSNQNDRPVNLSAQVQDVNKTCGLVYVFNLFGFTFHTGFWVDSKHNDTGETKSWQKDEEAAHSDSNLYSVLQLEASSPIENYYTSKAISVVVRTRM